MGACGSKKDTVEPIPGATATAAASAAPASEKPSAPAS